MAMGTNGSRNRRRHKTDPFSEINVTPMVDVMLVLLVIFMVAAPMMTTGVTVDLPKTAASPIAGQDEPLSVSITPDGQIYIQKTPVALKDLRVKLGAITHEKKDTRIFVSGAQTLDYGRVMQVFSEIAVAGYTRVALLTDPSGGAATDTKAR